MTAMQTARQIAQRLEDQRCCRVTPEADLIYGDKLLEETKGEDISDNFGHGIDSNELYFWGSAIACIDWYDPDSFTGWDDELLEALASDVESWGWVAPGPDVESLEKQATDLLAFLMENEKRRQVLQSELQKVMDETKAAGWDLLLYGKELVAIPSEKES